jgi:hypothetical protein
LFLYHELRGVLAMNHAKEHSPLTNNFDLSYLF